MQIMPRIKKPDSLKHYLLATAMATLMLSAIPAASEQLNLHDFKRSDQEFSLILGFGANHKIPKATTDRFQFDLATFRYAVFTTPRTQLAVDISKATSHVQENFAIWATGSYRRYFMVHDNEALGYDFNFGLLKFHEPVSEQGTRINFTEQLGLVYTRSIGKSSSVSLEYKWSHISNAGVRLPNIGINSSVLTLGYSVYR